MGIRDFFRRDLAARNGLPHGNRKRFAHGRLARFELLEQRTLLSVSPVYPWDTPIDWGVPVSVVSNPDATIGSDLIGLYADYITAPEDFRPRDQGWQVEDDRVAIEIHAAGDEKEAVETLRALGLDIYYQEDLHSLSRIVGFCPIERLVDVSAVDNLAIMMKATIRPGQPELPDLGSLEYKLSHWYTDDLIELYTDYLASPDVVSSDHPGVWVGGGRVGICVDTLYFDTEGRVEQLRSMGMEVGRVTETEIRGWLPLKSLEDLTEMGGPFEVRPGYPVTGVYSPKIIDLSEYAEIPVDWDAEIVSKFVDLNLIRFFRRYEDAGGKGPITVPTSLFPTNGDRVFVDVATDDWAAGWENALTKLGMEITSLNGSYLTGWLPLGVLGEVAHLESVCMVDSQVKWTTRSGLVDSLGDNAQRSDDLRAQPTGLDGTGVQVGVISDSYDTDTTASDHAADNVTDLDLPANVQVLEDYQGGTDEGRAMLQIVHDVAPGAELAFHTAKSTQEAMAAAIRELAGDRQSPGDEAGNDVSYRVIVDDFIYLDEPMFMDGHIAQAVRDVVSQQGVVYVSAAGNDADRSYESAFVATSIYQPGRGLVHDFDPGPFVDPHQDFKLTPGQSIKLRFQWDQPFWSQTPQGDPSCQNDMNIYVLDGSDQLLASSIRSNIRTGDPPVGTGDPVEYVTYENTSQVEVDCKLLITRLAGDSPGLMKYVNFGSDIAFEYATNSSTLYGHTNADGALATGAAFYLQTPEFGVSPPQPESFTTLGGTPILFDRDGNRLATPENRANPDIVAPDGANTTFFGTDITENPDDTHPNFFGTSAAASHAAAVAALLREEFPYSPAGQIYAALQSTAIDMESPGFDSLTGAGLIEAVAAESLLHQGVVTYDADDDPASGDQADDGNPDTFLIRRNGDDVEVRVNGSLVAQIDVASLPTITINGSTDTDAITIESLGSDFVGTLLINGGTGADNSIDLVGTAEDETLELWRDDQTATNPIVRSWRDHGTLISTNLSVRFNNVHDVDFDGISGDDTAILPDEATTDTFCGYYTGADWYYGGSTTPQVHVQHVANVIAVSARGGDDYAKFYDWTGDDQFVAAPSNGYGEFFYSDGLYTRASGFDEVDAFATKGGFDKAKFYDTTGNDHFWANPNEGQMLGPGDSYDYRGKYFDEFRAFGSIGGHDTASLFPSAGNDTFWANALGEGGLSGSGFNNWVKHFEEISGHGSLGGEDIANLFGSENNDHFVGKQNYAMMTDEPVGGGAYTYKNIATNFKEATGNASDGADYDRADLYDSSGDDSFWTTPYFGAFLNTGTYYVEAKGFDGVNGHCWSEGYDSGKFYDSDGDDTFYAEGDEGMIWGESQAGINFYHRAVDFELVRAFATQGGSDHAFLHDSTGNDQFWLYASEAYVKYGGSFRFRAKFFEHVHGYAENGGNDVARLYDSSTTVDTLWARDDQAKVENTSYGWSRIAEAFDTVYAYSSDSLDDNEDLPDPITLLDFVLNLDNWDL